MSIIQSKSWVANKNKFFNSMFNDVAFVRFLKPLLFGLKFSPFIRQYIFLSFTDIIVILLLLKHIFTFNNSSYSDAWQCRDKCGAANVLQEMLPFSGQSPSNNLGAACSLGVQLNSTANSCQLNPTQNRYPIF